MANKVQSFEHVSGPLELYERGMKTVGYIITTINLRNVSILLTWEEVDKKCVMRNGSTIFFKSEDVYFFERDGDKMADVLRKSVEDSTWFTSVNLSNSIKRNKKGDVSPQEVYDHLTSMKRNEIVANALKKKASVLEKEARESRALKDIIGI